MQEKRIPWPESCGPSTEIAAKRERTTDGTERSADKEVKRRKCPPTSGNGKRKEKRMRRPRERKWRRRREQDLEQGYISKKEKEKRERTSEKKREREEGEGGRSRNAYRRRLGRTGKRDKTDFLVSRSSLDSHFIRAKIFCEGVTFVASAGNKTQNAFETAPVAPPAPEHLARSERERQFLDATGQP